MTELAQLAGAGRTDVLAGYELKPWRLIEYADAEQEFAQRHLRAAGEAAKDLPKEVADRVIALALADVKRGDFSWGVSNFDRQLFLASNLPFVLWLSLRQKHPKLKRVETAELLTDENQGVVQKAILEMLGFDFATPDKKKARQGKLKSRTLGENISPTSAKSASSPTVTSPA
jgi:hypothetical protein